MGILGIIGTAGDESVGFGRYETKRDWMWKVEFFPMADDGTLGATVLTEDVKKSLTVAATKVTRPQNKFSEVSLEHANEKWSIAGKTSWNEGGVTIDFDDVIPSTGSGAGDSDPLYSASGIFHKWHNEIQDITTGSGKLSKDYKANIVVTQYNPAAEAIERFIYYGAWPLEVTQGAEWDYSKDTSGGVVTVKFVCDKIFRAAVEETTPPASATGYDLVP